MDIDKLLLAQQEKHSQQRQSTFWSKNKKLFVVISVMFLIAGVFFLINRDTSQKISTPKQISSAPKNTTKELQALDISYKKEMLATNDARLFTEEYGKPESSTYYQHYFSLERPVYQQGKISIWLDENLDKNVTTITQLNTETRELQTWEFDSKVSVDKVFYLPDSDQVIVDPFIHREYPPFFLHEGSFQPLETKEVANFLVAEFKNDYLILASLPEEFEDKYYSPKLIKRGSFDHLTKLPEKWKKKYDLLKFSPSGRYAHYIGSPFEIDGSQDGDIFYVFDLQEDKVLNFTYLISHIGYKAIWSTDDRLAYYHPSEVEGEKYHFGCQNNIARFSVIDLRDGKNHDLYTSKAKIVDLISWSENGEKLYFEEWDCHIQGNELKEITISDKKIKSLFKP